MAFWVYGKREGEKLAVDFTAGIAGQDLPLCRLPAKEWIIWSTNSLETMCLLLSQGIATAISPKGLCVDAQAGTSIMKILCKKSICGDRNDHRSLERTCNYSVHDSCNKPNGDCGYIQQKEL